MVVHQVDIGAVRNVTCVFVMMLQFGGEPVHVPMSLRARAAAQARSLTYTCTNEPVWRGPLCRRSD